MKKYFLLSLVACISFFAKAQKLYDINVIQKVEIKFAFDNWDALMDAAAASPADGYTVALWCKVNGVQYDSVGVKFKGNSSYKATNAKNPLHIELNYVKGNQSYKGYTDLKLSSGFADPTFVREVLSYTILSDYMDAPDANFANVYINGKKYGFFTSVQNINNVFFKSHFGRSDGTFVKCTPAAGAGGGGANTGYCTLKYLGKDSALYKTKYDMKTVGGFKDLINLCDTMSNNPKGMESVIDVNRAIWMIAFNNLLSNYDSYTGAFAQNYNLYKDHTNRFLPIMWDFNMSFGGFPGGAGGPGGGATDVSKTDAFLQQANADRPLIKNILSNPTYRRMYVANIKTMIDDWFANSKYYTEGKTMQAIADTAFNADPNKITSYANYKIALTSAVTVTGGGPGGGNTPGVKALMDSRMAFYKTIPEFTKVAPSISKTAHSKATIGKTVTITTPIKGATSVVLRYRYTDGDIFETVKMKNGVAPNDTIWTADFIVQKPDIQYYIYAENADAGMFSPRQAEHKFHSFTATATNTIKLGAVIVNEVMANNKTAVVAPNGKFSDWIELYNTTNADIDMSNAELSDNYSTPKKWLFPNGTNIKANNYLIVWCDDADTGAGLHASFKLTDNGERFLLSDPNGKYLDSLGFNNQKADFSLARCPNGNAKWIVTKPTFNASNGNCVSGTDDSNSLNIIQLYPNPASESFTILNSENNIGTVILYDLTGKIILTSHFDSHEAQLDITHLPNGMYLLKVDGARMMKVVKE